MKRKVFFAVAAIMSMTAWAQNIAVVSPNNTTTICQTLDEAITSAANGSTIYLPGGGFQIKNETQIDKKLTIMGVSYRGDTDNVDGATIIAGSLNYVEGSSGSTVLGVYISGNINVGTETDSVLNLTVRYCNVNSIQVKHSQSSGMVINQCYIRGNSNFGYANTEITYCITNLIENLNGGKIEYCIVRGSWRGSSGYLTYYLGLHGVNNSIITGNIFNTEIYGEHGSWGNFSGVSNCTGSNNYNANWGDNPVTIEVGMADFFVKWNNGAISPASNFHFKEEYKEYESQVGIYAGSTPFRDDKSLAPIPRIVSKKVAEQTDGSGKLSIEVTVKTN